MSSDEVSSPVLTIRQLDICYMSPPVRAKVALMFEKHFDNDPDELGLVFVDEHGNRIAGTVRSNLVAKFKSRIKEGRWYLFSDFEVTTKSERRKWTDHYLHIYFHPGTKCDRLIRYSKAGVNCFQKFEAIHDGVVSKTINIVDLIGGIIKVEKMREKDGDEDDCLWTNTCWILTFYLQDWEGKKMKCFALDGYAEQFEEMWLANDRGQIVFCELLFWDLQVDSKGEFCAFAQREYSKIKFFGDHTGVPKEFPMNPNLNQWFQFEDEYDEDNEFKYPLGFYHPYR